jgi:hypothetical protein
LSRKVLIVGVVTHAMSRFLAHLPHLPWRLDQQNL